jgi:hypothetical protein
MVLHAGNLSAQGADGPSGPEWRFEGLELSFCVDFLIELAPAAKRLPKGFEPVAAARFAQLHPALRSMIDAEPVYREWIPSVLCTYGAAVVEVDGRPYGPGGPGSRQMVGMWAIAGTPEEDRTDSLWVVAEFLTGSDRIKRAAEGSLLRLRGIDEVVGQDPESGEDLHGLKIGKTRITWIGHLGADSTRAVGPMRRLWWLKGNRGTTWLARLSGEPAWRQPMVGGLRVEGKDDLAKGLKSSPIRMLGPAFWGGSATLVFERQ